MLVEHMDPFEVLAACRLGANFEFRCKRCRKKHRVYGGTLSAEGLKCELEWRGRYINKTGQVYITAHESANFKLPQFNIAPVFISGPRNMLTILKSAGQYAAPIAEMYDNLELMRPYGYKLSTKKYELPLALLSDNIELRSFVLQEMLNNQEYQRYLNDCKEFMLRFYEFFLKHPEFLIPSNTHDTHSHYIMTDRYGSSYFGLPIPPAPILMLSVKLKGDRYRSSDEIVPDLSDPITRYLSDFLDSVYNQIDINAVLERYYQVASSQSRSRRAKGGVNSG